MKIGIVGAGLMGSQIAQVLATFGHEVIVIVKSDRNEMLAESRIYYGSFGLDKLHRRGQLSETPDSIMDKIDFRIDWTNLRDCEIVIECVNEDLSLKKKILRQINRIINKDCILASNTSGFSIGNLATSTDIDRADKVIGMHWFNPPQVMGLVEVVVTTNDVFCWSKTSKSTIDKICALAKSCEKTPIIVQDSMRYGHVANRIYRALVKEAKQVVKEELVTEEQVDKITKLGFGFPMGPFEVLDFIGKSSRKTLEEDL